MDTHNLHVKWRRVSHSVQSVVVGCSSSTLRLVLGRFDQSSQDIFSGKSMLKFEPRLVMNYYSTILSAAGVYWRMGVSYLVA